jgi:DNA-binding response OmpR family regulator
MPIRERVLIIDDESYIREFVSQVLSEKYHVFFAKNGPDGLTVARQVNPDVIVLDILMAGQNGIETCQALRKDPVTADTPIVMLTALNETEQRIQAFSAGADDYVSKPFHPEELFLRVAAKIRRSKQPKFSAENVISTSLKYGDISIALQDLKASIGDQAFDIGPVEFKILSLMIRKSGQLVSREEIEKFIWNDSPPSERALDPHITSLRKKLRTSQVELKMVYGQGYCLVVKGWAHDS